MDIEIKSINKEKIKTNKLALVFLFIPTIFAIIGIAFGFFSLYGSILVNSFLLGLFLSIYGVLYITSIYNLYIRRHASRFRIWALALNFILLFAYFVLLINAIGETGAGFVLLMILIIAIIILGIFGGFLYDPSFEGPNQEDILRKHRGYIVAFKIMVILLIVRYLVSVFYLMFMR